MREGQGKAICRGDATWLGDDDNRSIDGIPSCVPVMIAVICDPLTSSSSLSSGNESSSGAGAGAGVSSSSNARRAVAFCPRRWGE